MTSGIATLNLISAEPAFGKADYTRELSIKTKHLLHDIAKTIKAAEVAMQKVAQFLNK